MFDCSLKIDFDNSVCMTIVSNRQVQRLYFIYFIILFMFSSEKQLRIPILYYLIVFTYCKKFITIFTLFCFNLTCYILCCSHKIVSV